MRKFGERVVLTLVALVLSQVAAKQALELHFENLRQQGAGIVAQVEAYYQTHGHYPESAESAGLELPVTRYGAWQHERRSKSWKLVDGAVADVAEGGFHLKLSTKLHPRSLWRPYFTLSWMSGRGWNFSTDAC